MDVESIMQHYLRDCILGLVEFQNCWKSKLVTLYPFGPNSTSPTAYKCMKVPKCKNSNKSQCTYRTYFTANIARSRWRLNQYGATIFIRKHTENQIQNKMGNTKIHRLQDTFHAQYTLARLSADGGWINIMQVHMVAQLSAHFPYHFPLTNPDPNHNNLTNSVFFAKKSNFIISKF